MGRAWDLEIVFEGAPVAQGRVRAVRCRRTGMVRMHTPRRTEAYRRTIRLMARMHLSGLPSWQRLAGALSLDLRFYLPRPKRLIWKRRPMYAQLAPVKPDITNLAKCIEDALNGVAWLDDSEIVHEEIWKMYVAGPGYGDPRPRVELRVKAITDLIHCAPNWDGLDIDSRGPTRAERILEGDGPVAVLRKLLETHAPPVGVDYASVRRWERWCNEIQHPSRGAPGDRIRGATCNAEDQHLERTE